MSKIKSKSKPAAKPKAESKEKLRPLTKAEEMELAEKARNLYPEMNEEPDGVQKLVRIPAGLLHVACHPTMLGQMEMPLTRAQAEAVRYFYPYCRRDSKSVPTDTPYLYRSPTSDDGHDYRLVSPFPPVDIFRFRKDRDDVLLRKVCVDKDKPDAELQLVMLGIQLSVLEAVYGEMCRHLNGVADKVKFVAVR